ncbi:MAG: hypothetical protein AMXMBFR13_09550 [Phycisphaerae bacterium]
MGRKQNPIAAPELIEPVAQLNGTLAVEEQTHLRVRAKGVNRSDGNELVARRRRAAGGLLEREDRFRPGARDVDERGTSQLIEEQMRFPWRRPAYQDPRGHVINIPEVIRKYNSSGGQILLS